MGISLLVVDDSRISRKVTMAMLREVLGQDISCVEATGGEEAMAALATGGFDLMMLDLTMPGMTGYDVLAAMAERAIKLPVIVLSADIQPLAQERVLKLGARAFLKKPLTVETLKAELDRQEVRNG